MDQAARDKTKRFIRYLKRRENKLSGSGLMNASINVGISSVNKFFEYLLQSGNVTMVPDNLQYMEELYKPRVVLTFQEVNALYEATYMQKWFTSSQSKEYQGAIQQRDRAMLGVYYGCGLRKREGASLIVSDILTER